MNELHKFSLKDLQRPKQDIVAYFVIVSTRRKNIYFFTTKSSEPPSPPPRNKSGRNGVKNNRVETKAVSQVLA